MSSPSADQRARPLAAGATPGTPSRPDDPPIGREGAAMGDFPALVQYRKGQHLTSALFQREQEFHRTLLERHAIAAHEWGIAEGMELSAAAVEPRLAYDGFGRPL